MQKILKIFQNTRKDLQTPIWMMRQAGRHLPEYLEIRKNTTNFLDLCYDVSKATEVTLQPVNRYDVDAAIVFSDILVLPHALGWQVDFKKGEGPILQKLFEQQDLEQIEGSFSAQINNVYEIISNVRSRLSSDKTLIGFAGSPWTVATYMIEGKGKQDFSKSKLFIYNQKELVQNLIDILTQKTIEYLSNQILAGADVIQLFDSWSGVLSGTDYQDFVIAPTKSIVKALKGNFPGTPIIGFPRGSGFNYDQYIAQTGIDGVSVDQFTPIECMHGWSKKIVVQGNLEPVLLLSQDQSRIKQRVDEIMSKMYGENFIFNLGHGILPTTPIKNVEFLVDYVKNFSK